MFTWNTQKITNVGSINLLIVTHKKNFRHHIFGKFPRKIPQGKNLFERVNFISWEWKVHQINNFQVQIIPTINMKDASKSMYTMHRNAINNFQIQLISMINMKDASKHMHTIHRNACNVSCQNSNHMDLKICAHFCPLL